MSKNIQRILFLMSFAVFILIVNLLLPSKNELCHKAYKKIRSIEYNGKIINTYLDYNNHAIPTYEVIEDNDNVIKITDFRDMSGLFEYIEVGDSIIKYKNSYTVSVFRKNQKMDFILNYNCK
jgi:hypothetical protein